MRKVILMLLAVMLITGALPAYAQESIQLAGFEDASTSRDWSNNLFFSRLSEKFDIGFTFSQFTDYALWQKEVDAYLNGGPLPDALFKAELTVEQTLALYEKGIIIDLRPFIESVMPNLNAILKENPAWADIISLPDGAIAALPGISQLQTNNVIWVNTAWLGAVKMDMPTDRESFEQVLRAFKTQDPNKNGKNDEIPLTFLGVWDLKFLAHAYGLVANDYNVFVDEAGEVRHLAFQDAFRPFVQWLADLYQEGLIDKDGFMTSDAMRQITDEKATIPYGMLMGSSPANLLPKADLSLYDIMMPLSYEGKQVYRDLTGPVARGAFAVTKNLENPGALLAAMDYLYSEEGAMLAQVGQKDVEYTIDEEGRWMWIATEDTDLSAMVRNATIADGGTLAYMLPVEQMLNIGDTNSRNQLTQLKAFNAFCVMPYPLVTLDAKTRERVDALQLTLGAVLEKHVGRFVLGQVPLDDATWQAFLDELTGNGLEEFISLWQSALNER